MTCFADCAAMRPKSIGGSGSISQSSSCGVRLDPPRVVDGQLGEEVLRLLDHVPVAGQRQVAGLAVDLGADVVLGAVARARGLAERILHRLDHEAGVDHLLAGDRVGDLQELEPVGRGHAHFTSSSLIGGFFVRCVFGHDLVEGGGVEPLRLAPGEALGDQRVGQHQLRVGRPCRRRARSSPRGSRAAPRRPRRPASVPLNRRCPSIGSVGLELRLVARPALEVLQPGQRPVDAGARHLEHVLARDRILDVEHRRHRPADPGAVVDLDAAVRPLGHDLQHRAPAAHQPQPHQLEAQTLDRRLRRSWRGGGRWRLWRSGRPSGAPEVGNEKTGPRPVPEIGGGPVDDRSAAVVSGYRSLAAAMQDQFAASPRPARRRVARRLCSASNRVGSSQPARPEAGDLDQASRRLPARHRRAALRRDPDRRPRPRRAARLRRRLRRGRRLLRDLGLPDHPHPLGRARRLSATRSLGFYERRARRILPALMVARGGDARRRLRRARPGPFAALARSAIATTLFVSNLWFWHTSSDYFGADVRLAPLLHTWSLAVEEQFYIFFPLLLALIARGRPPPARSLAIAGICLVSFALSRARGRHRPAAGRLLPAAQPRLGARRRRRPRPRRRRRVPRGRPAVEAIALARRRRDPRPGPRSTTPATPFPGPRRRCRRCLGTAALIWLHGSATARSKPRSPGARSSSSGSSPTRSTSGTGRSSSSTASLYGEPTPAALARLHRRCRSRSALPPGAGSSARSAAPRDRLADPRRGLRRLRRGDGRDHRRRRGRSALANGLPGRLPPAAARVFAARRRHPPARATHCRGIGE